MAGGYSFSTNPSPWYVPGVTGLTGPTTAERGPDWTSVSELGTKLPSRSYAGMSTMPGDVGSVGPGMADYYKSLGGGGWGSNVNWGGVAATAAPLIGSLFAPKSTDIKGPTAEAYSAARNLQAQGAATQAQGAEALGPTLRYLSAIQSGDPSQILAATMPERRRVLDQYDTARQAVQFQPRGGGTSAAMTELNAREASDLAMLAPEARRGALQLGAQLGTSLTGQGLTTQAAATSDLGTLLARQQEQKQRDDANTWQTWASIAAMAAMFI